MKALIVDDGHDARGVLRELIDLICPEIQYIDEAADTQNAIKKAQSTKFDVAFIDIELGRECGLMLAEAIVPYCRNLIFVTAHDKYALQAFQTAAIHYLLKPVHPKHLQQAMAKISGQQEGLEDSRILVFGQTGVFVVRPVDLLYVSGEGNYSTFFLSSGEKIVASKHLAYYESQFNMEHFFRIHQSYLVNLDFVKQIDTRDSIVIMVNENRLPLARRRKENFLAALQ